MQPVPLDSIDNIVILTHIQSAPKTVLTACFTDSTDNSVILTQIQSLPKTVLTISLF
jgi:hypothetical protein